MFHISHFICHMEYDICGRGNPAPTLLARLNFIFHMAYAIWLPFSVPSRSFFRNPGEARGGEAKIAFPRAIYDAAFANDLATENLAVNAQFLFANLRISDRDAFDRAIALPQSVRAVFQTARVGQITFRVDLSGQAFNALIEIPPAQLLLELRDQFIGARPEHA